MNFTDATGKFLIKVNAVATNATSVLVSVPPFVDPNTGNIGPATVTVQIINSSGQGSNIIGGFQIEDLPPSPPVASGAVTLAFLQAVADLAPKLQSQIKSTALDTPEFNADLLNQQNQSNNLISLLQPVVQGSAASADLGAVNGTEIIVGAKDLAVSDRMLAGQISALANISNDALFQVLQSNTQLRPDSSLSGTTNQSNQGPITLAAQDAFTVLYGNGTPHAFSFSDIENISTSASIASENERIIAAYVVGGASLYAWALLAGPEIGGPLVLASRVAPFMAPVVMYLSLYSQEIVADVLNGLKTEPVPEGPSETAQTVFIAALKQGPSHFIGVILDFITHAQDAAKSFLEIITKEGPATPNNYTATFTGSVTDQGNGGCPGTANLSGSGTFQFSQVPSGIAIAGSFKLSQLGGICDDYSGTYNCSSTAPSGIGATIGLSCSGATTINARGGFTGSAFSGQWDFKANNGPDVGTGTFAMKRQ